MNKNVTTAVVLLSLLILCSSFSKNDVYVSSQTNTPTTTNLTVDLNPIGIGQMVTFYASIQPPFPSLVNVFSHYIVNLTLPDGNYQAYIPQKYAPDGSFTINFVPTQIGNYTAVLNFPGKTFDNGATYLPSVSQAITLKVTATPIPTPIPSPTTPPPQIAKEWSTIKIASPSINRWGSPSVSYDGSKIAFCANGNGKSELFVVNSDGTGLKQLSGDTRIYSHPCISGDGKKIACITYSLSSLPDGYSFITDEKLIVINSDGTGLNTLLSENKSLQISVDRPAVTRNGAQIAFIGSVPIANTSLTNPTYELALFVISSDGTGLKQIASHLSQTADDHKPSISGDGSKIAFSGSFDYDPYGQQRFFVINFDGTGLTELALNNKNPDYWVRYPVISDDGSKVAFSNWIGNNYQIFVVNSDGTGLRQITQNVADNRSPSISGDGSKIVFRSFISYNTNGFDSTYGYDPYAEGWKSVMLINSDGTELEAIANIGYLFDPSISADGSKIVYYDNKGGADALFVSSKSQGGSSSTIAPTNPSSSTIAPTNPSSSTIAPINPSNDPLSATASPAPTYPTPTSQIIGVVPTVPEFTFFILLLLLAMMLAFAGLLHYKKKEKMSS